MKSRNAKQRKGARSDRRRGVANDKIIERRLGRDRRVRVVYVGCEGRRTEPDYLDHLTEDYGRQGDERRFHIHPVVDRNGLLPTEAVDRVHEKMRDHGGDCEGWVLFDRDGMDRDPDIHRALGKAAAHKIEVGFSHPSFDLWLLLHFQPFSGAQRGSSVAIVERLRNAKEATGFHDYDKRNNKSIDDARWAALRGNLDDAVKNARKLVDHCEHQGCRADKATTVPDSGEAAEVPPEQWSARSGHKEHCPVLGRDPSTDVWRLLVALGIVATGRGHAQAATTL